MPQFSWASKFLSLLLTCNQTAVFNGTWSYHGLVSQQYNPWKHCPNTNDFIDSNRYLKDHEPKYSCLGVQYRRAAYRPASCQLIAMEDSLHSLAEHKQKLMLYIFLRNDQPCDDRCLSNATFLAIQPEIKSACIACPEGKRRSLEEYLNNPSNWFNLAVTQNVSAVVLNCGAWYNIFQGIIDSNAVYAETLRLVGATLHKLVTKHGIEVFWVGLPPHNIDTTKMNATDYGYEWIHFEEKDAIARSIMEPLGVTFIDTAALLKARKRLDPRISPDGVHWCNPGLDAVPSFLNRVIFHLLVVRKGLAWHHRTDLERAALAEGTGLLAQNGSAS